jgi:hypothetical protein
MFMHASARALCAQVVACVVTCVCVRVCACMCVLDGDGVRGVMRSPYLVASEVLRDYAVQFTFNGSHSYRRVPHQFGELANGSNVRTRCFFSFLAVTKKRKSLTTYVAHV